VKKFLLIQTAFPGDVILATSLIEKLHQYFPETKIDFLLRKGNESILANNPYLNEIIQWDKRQNKYSGLYRLISVIRKKKYDCVINLQRFGSSGILTLLSGAKSKIGFDKNPFSFFFTSKITHQIGNGKHEIERNHELIKELTDSVPAKPKLYPSADDFAKVKTLLQQTINNKPYVCIAPASVWFTKQWPKEKWSELINNLPVDMVVFLIGSKDDVELCNSIRLQTIESKSALVFNVAGKFSFLESAALMNSSTMNYVNDSAPLHITSAMNAPVTVIFCSTIPAFGFGPLSNKSKISETTLKLECRPCGLHGFKACPLQHFNCAQSIQINDVLGITDHK